VILGLGQGAGYTVMFAAATANTPAHRQGIASGAVSTAQQIGGAASSDSAGDTTALTTGGLRTAVFVAAAGIPLTALAALGFSPARRAATTGGQDDRADSAPIDTPPMTSVAGP